MVNTQLIPYLSKVGYTVVERGYILAGNAIIAILGQFLFGYLSDRYKRMKIFFLCAYLLFMLASFGMFLVARQVFYYHLCTVSLMGGMVKVIMGLDETWMLAIDEKHYGMLRAWGAMGLTIGSPIAGWMVHDLPYSSLLIAGSICSILLFITLFYVQDANHRNTTGIQLQDMKELWMNRAYRLLVLIYVFVYMIGTADQYVVIDKMLTLHASNTLIGMKWALQSIMEVPLFLLAGWILKRWKTSTLLWFGTLMYGCKFLLYAWFQSPWGIIATASLQLVTLPIIMLTSKIFIKKVTPEKLFASAQMFAMAIFIGGSGLITPLITAFLSKHYGYDGTLYIVACFAIVPLLCIYYYIKMSKKANQKLDETKRKS